MGDATGGGRLETKVRERKNNDVTRSTTRKRTITSPTCIFDGPKRSLFYTPRDGGIKAGGKRLRGTQNMTSHGKQRVNAQ